MDLERHWRRIRDAFLDLLFPPRCVVCRRDGDWLCPLCQEQIQLIDYGEGLRLSVDGLGPGPALLDGMRSAAYSEGVLREAIHEFKYNGVRVLAGRFAEMMYACWLVHRIPGDLLIPVPLHAQRVRERGYNQSLLLAQRLSAYTGLPVNSSALVRTRYTRPQVSLHAQERHQNVDGAFRCTSSDLARRRIILIDDVCTTGATLNACAQALKLAGVGEVWALTLARARDMRSLARQARSAETPGAPALAEIDGQNAPAEQEPPSN